MINPLPKLRALRSLVRLVKDPNAIDDVFGLADSVLDDSMARAMIERHSKHEQGRTALRDLPRLGRIDLDALAALPAGTLGKLYADHMRANHLDPATMPSRGATTPAEYILPHVYECHDVWHVVTGFGTSVADEMGLQAFSTAQGPTKGPWAVITAGFLNALLYRIDDKDPRISAVVRGWLLGRRAKPLFGVRWRELWSVPLADVRRQFAVDVDGIDGLLRTECA